MTLYVGTSAGAYDKGMCRIRRAATATVLYIGETSEIAFADNDYLTVVDEFGLWPKALRIVGGVTFMDYDIAYSDQHKYPAPVPVLGADQVLWLTGATVSHTRTAVGSYVVGSGAIASYQHTAASASAISNDTTDTATITYNAASGMAGYRESCTLTSGNSKTMTGYRQTWVFDATHLPVTDFTLEGAKGDYESGGWEFTIKMPASATLSTVRDRAKVVLFSRDYYGGVESEIGPVAGSENVIASGWIDGGESGERITWNPEQGEVVFTVKGPAYWLGKMQSFPTGIKNINNSDPTTWLRFRDLTVDKGVWHFLHHRSTATAVMDCYLSGDTRALPTAESPASSLWQQLTDIADLSILAKPACDRYGRLFVEVNQQFLPDASRSIIPVVMAMTKPDWREKIDIERSTVSKVGLLVASGVSYNGVKGFSLWSKAPGNVPKRYGDPEPVDSLLFANQTDANVTAGMLLANANNEYSSVSMPLSANNRLIDICPKQYITATAAVNDTVRGISFTDKKFIPRRIEYSHETGEDGGNVLLVDLECEAETTGPIGVTYIPPKPPPAQPYQPPVPGEPSYPPFPPPYIPWLPPVLPPVIEPIGDCITDMGAEENTYPLFFKPTVLSGADADEADRTAYALTGACYIRAAAADHPSFVYFPISSSAFGYWSSGVWRDADPSAWVHVYAVDAAKNVVLNGSPVEGIEIADFFGNTEGWVSNFSPVSATEIAGIKVVIDEDGYAASGNATLEQVAAWGDPDTPTYTAEFYPFVGAAHGTNTSGNRWLYFVFKLNTTGSYPAGNLRVTMQINECNNIAPAFGGMYETPGYSPQIARNVTGWNGEYPGVYPNPGELIMEPTGATYTYRTGYFGFTAGWYVGHGAWDISFTITKLEWKTGGVYYDLWSAYQNTGLTVYLSGAQICNVCPKED